MEAIHSANQDKTNYISKEEVWINSCGVQTHSGQMFSVIREHGRFDYHILFIKSGKCYARYENNDEILKANDFIIYYPNQSQKYTFNEDLTVSYWIHFSGSRIENILSKCRLHPGTYHIDNANDIFADFDKLLNLKQMTSDYCSMRCCVTFVELLCKLSDKVYFVGDNMRISSELIGYMNSHFAEDISVFELAQKANLSIHRFSHIFKEQVGMSPHQYHILLRMNEAKWLLKYSTLNISEIAKRIGYSDSLYFSRLFTKHEGVSPMKYKTSCG